MVSLTRRGLSGGPGRVALVSELSADQNPTPELAGMYKGGQFKFTVAISTNYPHEPPKVKCIPKVSKPSLDLPKPPLRLAS